jgi:DNA repair exonuclease SbcCD ATPase subunit
MDTPVDEIDEKQVAEETPVDQGDQASPEELGVGQRQSNEPFSPVDFDSIVDKAFGAAQESKPAEETTVAENAATEEKDAAVEDNTKEEAPKKEDKAKEEPETAKEEPAAKEDVKEEVKEETPKEIAEIESKLGQHTSPKTKQLFAEVKNLASKERAEREKVSKELEETRKQIEELKKTTQSVPKEVEQEIQQLRDKVRQFDANADPAIINKYDSVISKNNESIIKTLTDAGLPEAHAAEIKKKGVSLSSLKQYLDTLETGKGADGKQYEADPDTAERIRESLRENMRLSKDKEREIESWKSGYEERTKKTEEEQKNSVEMATQRLNKEFETHIGQWDFLKKPSDVNDNDAPAIRKQKEDSIKQFNETALKYAESIKKETSNPLDAQIAARIGILYRDHVAPALKSRLSDAQKEIETLRSQVASMKKAGSATRSVGTVAPRATQAKEVSVGDGFDDILDNMTQQALSNRSS